MAKWTPEEDARLAGMLADGMTLKEAAEGLGRPYPSVNGHVFRRGGRDEFIAASRRAADVPGERLRELFERGLPYEAIAKETGLSKAVVSSRCHAMGLFRTLKDGHRMRGAMTAYRAENPKPTRRAPWHVQGDGPLARRFNAQQDRIWAEGGPKPVRYRDGYYDETAVW